MHRQPKVLILYHVPRSEVAHCRTCAPRESDAGVLEEVRAVCAALGRLRIDYRVVGVAALTELRDVLTYSLETVVVNLIEDIAGQPQDAALVPAISQAYGKTCTGSDSNCLMLAQDKWKTKAILQSAGLECPSGMLVLPGGSVPMESLPEGPYIVKPLFSDASEGIDAESVLDRPGPALQEAARRIHKEFRQPALVEQFVGHRELNVSLLERAGHVEVLPIAEIDFGAFGESRPRIVGYSAKWLPESFEFRNTPRMIPAPLTASEAAHVRRMALTAWEALGCRDYVRVDFRLSAQGRPVILEVNPNPDISPDAGFAAALEAGEISYDEFVGSLLENAIARLPEGESPCRVVAMPEQHALTTVRIREARSDDRDAILSLLTGTDRFHAFELAVAKAVLDEALRPDGQAQYQSLVADDEGTAVGWICFGPTPCTLGTFDIYWLGVSPSSHRKGLGTMLVQRAEECLRKMGARMIVVDTSGRGDYLPARCFYERQGYEEVSRIRDFYAPGDDKVTYAKLPAKAPSREGLPRDEKSASAIA